LPFFTQTDIVALKLYFVLETYQVMCQLKVPCSFNHLNVFALARQVLDFTLVCWLLAPALESPILDVLNVEGVFLSDGCSLLRFCPHLRLLHQLLLLVVS
jgi:hypothetical protein